MQISLIINISLGCIRWHKRITYVVYDWNQESGRSGFFVLGVLISHFSMIFLLDWNCVVLYVFPYIGTCFVFWFHWIINILISAMKQWWHYHSSLSWNCSWTLCFFHLMRGNGHSTKTGSEHIHQVFTDALRRTVHQA
jgi:hypothetical protein